MKVVGYRDANALCVCMTIVLSRNIFIFLCHMPRHQTPQQTGQVRWAITADTYSHACCGSQKLDFTAVDIKDGTHGVKFDVIAKVSH